MNWIKQFIPIILFSAGVGTGYAMGNITATRKYQVQIDEWYQLANTAYSHYKEERENYKNCVDFSQWLSGMLDRCEAKLPEGVEI